MPSVGTFHRYSTNTLSNGIAANVIGARRLYNKLGVRIAVSEAARWTAERYYGGRYRIVPNGVDLTAARPAPARPHEALELLFVGRAEARKGLPVLLRAFEALRSAGVPARLTVAGATHEEVEPLLLDHEGVDVAGRVTEEEKWRLLGQADLLCAPSLGGESFGMVLTEAFASSHAGGRLATSSATATWSATASTGCSCRPPTPSSWARRCATSRSTRTAASAMAAAARERAERFAWPQVAGGGDGGLRGGGRAAAPATRTTARRAAPGPAAADRAPRPPAPAALARARGAAAAAAPRRRGPPRRVVRAARRGRSGLTALALDRIGIAVDRPRAAGGDADLGAGRASA